MYKKKWFGLVLFITATQLIAAEQTEEQTEEQAEEQAEEQIEEQIEEQTVKKSLWNSEAELGLVKTTGNTETETFLLKARVVNQREKWRHIVRGEALRNAEGDDIVTAERYFLSGKSEYTFRRRSYVYGLITYDDDRFSGFNYIVTGILGYGRVVMDREKLKLNLEIGVGGRQSEPEIGETNNEAVFRAAGDFNWKISQSATFIQELSTDIGKDKTINRSLTALSTRINGYLSSRIAYQVKYTSEVPPGIEKTDTELTFTLVFKY